MFSFPISSVVLFFPLPLIPIHQSFMATTVLKEGVLESQKKGNLGKKKYKVVYVLLTPGGLHVFQDASVWLSSVIYTLSSLPLSPYSFFSSPFPFPFPSLLVKNIYTRLYVLLYYLYCLLYKHIYNINIT